MKKKLEIVLIVVGIILVGMILVPYAFNAKIASIVQTQANKRLNAKVSFSGLRLNLFDDFPNMTATLSDFSVAGIDSFAKDTLVSAQKMKLAIDLQTLFTENGLSIKSIELIRAQVLAKVLPTGKTNWDIMKPDSVMEVEKDSSKTMHFEMEEILVKHSNVVYDDRQSNMKAVVKDWNGKLKGDLSTDLTTLTTESTIQALSFTKSGMTFLSDATLDAELTLDVDFTKSKYTFKTNKIVLNAMELSFGGWVQMPDTSTMDMDLKLNTRKVTFKQFLSLIPALYLKEFESIQATGDLKLDAYIKGKMQGESYPAFGVKLDVKNGLFQYPGLPKSVKDILVKASISSTGGSLDQTKIDVSAFHINMAGNPFDMTAFVAYPLSDPDVKGRVKGVLNLGMIKEVYPLEKGTDLKGQIQADLSAAGRLSYLDKKQFDKFKANGHLLVKGVNYQSSDLPLVAVKEAAMSFSPKEIALTACSLMVGRNDLQATGRLTNVLAYLLQDGLLSGSLQLTSSYLNLNDFMKKDSSASTQTNESVPMVAFEIPKNLNLNVKATGQKVLFSKLMMTGALGDLLVKEGRLTVNNLSANALGGTMGAKGFYEALNPAKPNVGFVLNLQNVSFPQTFKTFDMVKSMAPIFEKVEGNYSMVLDFKTNLNSTMDPDLMALTGSGVLKSNAVKVTNVKVLDALATALKKESLRTISPKDLKIPFKIEKGLLYTSPFDVNLGSLKLTMSGTTGLNKSIDYAVRVDLPTNLAVGGVTSLSGKITGTFSDPKVKLDAAALAKDVAKGLADQYLKKMTGKNVEETLVKAKEDVSKKAEEIRAQAKAAGDKLISEAEKEGNVLIDKAKNPILKVVAKESAAKLKAEAQKKAAALNTQAEAKIKELNK